MEKHLLHSGPEKWVFKNLNRSWLLWPLLDLRFEAHERDHPEHSSVTAVKWSGNVFTKWVSSNVIRFWSCYPITRPVVRAPLNSRGPSEQVKRRWEWWQMEKGLNACKWTQTPKHTQACITSRSSPSNIPRSYSLSNFIDLRNGRVNLDAYSDKAIKYNCVIQ